MLVNSRGHRPACSSTGLVPSTPEINDLGGFTGSCREYTTGSAEASVQNGTFTITGTAVGFFNDDPGERTDASFELRTDC